MNLLKKCFLFFCLLPSFLIAQVNDDFSDGDFNTGTVWSGDAADWVVVSGELRSNGPAITPTQIYLSTPSATSSDAQWEFYVNPKCATSGGNYMVVALMSDQADIESAYNGYYVMIGNTADEISLYRKDGALSTLIINGTDGIVSSSSNNPFKVKVLRDALGNWSLQTDNSGTGSSYVLQGIVSDNTYTSSAYMGLMVNYSAANNQKYFFDLVYAGPVIVDTTPPLISAVDVLSATQIDVDFNENVDLVSSENPLYYAVNSGIGNPLSATRDAVDFSIVHLTFSGTFIPLQNYTLTVNSVEDLSGNALNNETATFSYIPLSSAGYRDILIHEIFADPSPVVALPAGEFIELYNRSSNHFNLQNWTLSDGSSMVTLPAYILSAGEHLILCANSDTSSYAVYGNVLGATSFISLNNSGDQLVLKNDGGTTIDEVLYSDTWYQNSTKAQGGWTLELINPTLDCSGSNNWIASNHPSGGTPGIQNSVFSNSPDTIAARFVNVTVVSQTQLQVQFSESMDSLSLVNGTWGVSGGIGVSAVQAIAPDFIYAHLFLDQSIDSITLYNLSVSAVSDCAGNVSPDDTLLFGIGVAPLPYEVVINELFPDPDGSTLIPESEFIELKNTSNKVLQLNGFKLSDASSSATIGNCVLFPNDFILLTASASVNDYASYGRTYGLASWPSLNNSGDNMTLRNANGQLIHRVHYSDSWYADANKSQGGWTLEMIDPMNPCGASSNWRASADASGGTPGRENSVASANPDTDFPFPVLAEAISPTTVILHFNESMDSLSLLTGNYVIDLGVTVISQQVLDDKRVELILSPPLQNQTIYTLQASLCSDCVGNPVNSSITVRMALADNPQPGDLIINEILFDPRGSGSDFVEIYNRSERFISLKNWVLANGNNDTVSNPETISSTVMLLYPGEYLAVCTDKTNIVEEYPFAHADRVLEISSLPSYSNDAGRVFLIDDLNRISDEFSYTSEMHFPLLQSTDGVSLERIDFHRPASDNSNWHSAAEAVNFATPGYENSQLQNSENNGAIHLEPETFSPDNDGYNDVVNISYTLDQPGYIGNVVIYDAHGRIVKLLMQNELLAASGTISWDGINERREKAATGMYVVYMEVFDLNGNLKSYKKALVLAAKF